VAVRAPAPLRLVREDAAVDVLRIEERSEDGAEVLCAVEEEAWEPRVDGGRERSGGGGGGGGLSDSRGGAFAGNLVADSEGELGTDRVDVGR